MRTAWKMLTGVVVAAVAILLAIGTAFPPLDRGVSPETPDDLTEEPGINLAEPSQAMPDASTLLLGVTDLPGEWTIFREGNETGGIISEGLNNAWLRVLENETGRRFIQIATVFNSSPEAAAAYSAAVNESTSYGNTVVEMAWIGTSDGYEMYKNGALIGLFFRAGAILWAINLDENLANAIGVDNLVGQFLAKII